ncbi:MAG: hypothetical protein AAGD25_10035 [Cyanobacteria bacterium P01_F01_bin.150]
MICKKNDIAPHYLPNDERFSILITTRLQFGPPVQAFPVDVLHHQALEGDYQEDPIWTLTARRGLEAAFDLTWETLNAPSRMFAKMLGHFEPGPINWHTVDMMNQILAEEYPEDIGYDPEKMRRARSLLMKYSLLKPFDKKTYRLHPLIREFFRGKTTDEEYSRYDATA